MRLWQWITYPMRRGPRRPLAQRQPEQQARDVVPLGMEAVDLSVIDAVTRRNASLERVSTFFGRKNKIGSFLENAESQVTPFADDETYAARYHRAYNQKKGQTK